MPSLEANNRGEQHRPGWSRVVAGPVVVHAEDVHLVGKVADIQPNLLTLSRQGSDQPRHARGVHRRARHPARAPRRARAGGRRWPSTPLALPRSPTAPPLAWGRAEAFSVRLVDA